MMNEIKGKCYTNINEELSCNFKYTHTTFFEDIYKLQNNIIPIDIDMYQYIENDNYISNKLQVNLLNYISHFFNNHKSKFKFYLSSGNNILIFCEKLPKHVSLLQKKIFTNKLKQYNIDNFLFVNLMNDSNI